MEPLSQSFTDGMTSLARLVDEEWTGLEALEKRHADWEQELLARGTLGRTPQQQSAMLAEMEQILIEREARTVALASSLADYLESRRRAYAILNRVRSPDELHGPLDATVLVSARNRVLGRLRNLSGDIERAHAPLVALMDRMNILRREIDALEATESASTRLALRRQSLAALEEEWDREAERVRRFLGARDQLHADGVRILTAMGRKDTSIREWDTLGALARTRVARLAMSPAP
jgi:hypothetical protein